MLNRNKKAMRQTGHYPAIAPPLFRSIASDRSQISIRLLTLTTISQVAVHVNQIARGLPEIQDESPPLLPRQSALRLAAVVGKAISEDVSLALLQDSIDYFSLVAQFCHLVVELGYEFVFDKWSQQMGEFPADHIDI